MIVLLEYLILYCQLARGMTNSLVPYLHGSLSPPPIYDVLLSIDKYIPSVRGS